MGTRDLVVTSLFTVLVLDACSGQIMTGAGAPAGAAGAVNAESSGGIGLPATGGASTAGGVRSTGGDAAIGGLPSTGGAARQECSEVPAPNPHISDFTVWNQGVWGAQGDLTGGQSLYQSDSSATFAPSVDSAAANPNLRLTATVPSGGYAGYVMWFAPCLNASAYDGIRFQIAGSLGGATLDLQVQMNDNYPIDTNNLKGACVGGTWSETSCWNNHAPVTVKVDLTTVSYAWNQLTGGFPTSPVDPRQLLGIQWQVDCGATATCAVDLTIDTVEFF